MAPLTIEALRDAARAVVHVGRLLRDPPRLPRPDLGPRHALLAASRPPSRHGRDREDIAAFKASARSLDQGIGAVLHALHRRRPRRHTLVICTTDHGIAFPGAKATLFDRGIGVMLLMRGPHGFTGGKVVDAMVSHLDVFPTLCELAGVEEPGLAAGALADAAGARRGRAPARRDLRRDDLPRRLRAAARGAHRALEVHPALRRLRAPRAGQLRRQRQQGPAGRGRLGRGDRAARSSSTTCCSTRRRAATWPPTRVRARAAALAARPTRRVDAGDRRSAADGPGRSAAGSVVNARVSRPLEPLGPHRRAHRRGGDDPDRSYLVCATPRSGSTLVCQALPQTGVAGRPEEYFEALRHTGRPRRPEEYFVGVDDPSIFDHLGERAVGDEPPPRSPLWSRTAYDRYLEWAFEAGTTPNGVFGAKLMWGYFGDFVSLLRNVPAYRELPLAELLPPRSSPTSRSCASCAPTRCARRSRSGRRCRPPPGARTVAARRSAKDDGSRPTAASSRSTARSCASTTGRSSHLLDQILIGGGALGRLLRALRDQAAARPVRELRRRLRRPSTCNLLDRLGLDPPADFDFEPRMKRQSDGINDDWAQALQRAAPRHGVRPRCRPPRRA